jgi:hypothetical protein
MRETFFVVSSIVNGIAVMPSPKTYFNCYVVVEVRNLEMKGLKRFVKLVQYIQHF